MTIEAEYAQRIRLPSTLVVIQPKDDKVDRDFEREQIDMLTAIGYMSSMTLFVWNYHSLWTMGLPNFGALLFETLERLPSLEHLCLDLNWKFNPGIRPEKFKASSDGRIFRVFVTNPT